MDINIKKITVLNIEVVKDITGLYSVIFHNEDCGEIYNETYGELYTCEELCEFYMDEIVKLAADDGYDIMAESYTVIINGKTCPVTFVRKELCKVSIGSIAKLTGVKL